MLKSISTCLNDAPESRHKYKTGCSRLCTGAPLCTFALNTDANSHERWWNKAPESCHKSQNIASIFLIFCAFFRTHVFIWQGGKAQRKTWVRVQGLQMSGEVVICLQWSCNLGGKHIHPENCSLLKDWMFFLEEARCYLSCANKNIHYEFCFSPGRTTAPLCSQGESCAPGFEDVSVAFIRSSFVPESRFKCELVRVCVKHVFPNVLQWGLSHRGPWTEEEKKFKREKISAPNIKPGQERFLWLLK